MGFWTTLKGDVISPRSKRFSFRKYLDEVLKGDDFTFSAVRIMTSELNIENVYLSVEYDKDQLDKFLKKLNQDFKEKKIKCDLDVSTRFVVN